MTAMLISPSGAVLHHRARRITTPSEEAEAKAVRIRMKKECRLEENRLFLKNRNVKAFLRALSHAAGGGVDYLQGAVKGRRNDPWRFTDFSTHPGAGEDGITTAAGLYQISFALWRDTGGKMSLTDFTHETQDLIAVEVLRGLGVLEKLQRGELAPVLAGAAKRWPGLPRTPDCDGYAGFVKKYQQAGGACADAGAPT